ncbi:MAG: alpha-glucuronidase, partial [Sphingomonas bacterium]|uniref:alpha-glucuronidase family glycosyl hydrolase n=1 Tax=Sphingomonas bacterium TaxID=1895847 RepID=UPI00261B3F48
MRVSAWLKGLILLALLGMAGAAQAEDGYELWLRYQPVEAEWQGRYGPAVTALVPGKPSPSLDAAQAELARGLGGLLGHAVPVGSDPVAGAILFGTPASSPVIAGLGLPLGNLRTDGYLIRSISIGGKPFTVIASNDDLGVLYGSFAFLRLLQTRQPIDKLDLASSPAVMLRVLNHWDNLNGSIERGYAGSSLWKWQTLPAHIQPRYVDYARANASIGINGAVLNNVNSTDDILTPLYIEKVAALAAAWRPYGIKVYLSPRFTAPMALGRLKTADPTDPAVRRWWADEIAMIYRAIPDFGGFLVKASSEDQPGPQQYGRTHADGANMFGDLLAPHHGIVMYRAFVYADSHGDLKKERAVQAYKEFVGFDGQFRDNVIIQVKDGPFDFQPREPFHPLFGAMPKTALMPEFPITKEYLGQASEMSFTGVRYEEFLSSDTYEQGPGSTVAKVIDGTLDPHKLTGVAGVANTGSDRDWSGSIFNQANWYSFGRMAWDPYLTARTTATEWTRMTLGNSPTLVATSTSMMLRSYDAMVDYSMPLGLAFMMQRDTHFGPGMWDMVARRTDWMSGWFNRAAADGVGFDRTATGSDAVGQYHAPLSTLWADPKTTPDRYLLWFHHLPWDYRMKSGRTLWDELYYRYTGGIEAVDRNRADWASLKGQVDQERFDAVTAYLDTEKRESIYWRDAGMVYFESYSHRPFVKGYAP